MRSLTETARNIKDTDEPPWDYRRFEFFSFLSKTIDTSSSDLVDIP